MPPAIDVPELPLDDLLTNFQSQQREQLLVAVDKLITGAIRDQRDMLAVVERQAQERHLHAVGELRAELTRTQPTMLDAVTDQTLDAEKNEGLVSWIGDETKKQQASECVNRLKKHLEKRHGNAFRSDFEALLVVYMEYLRIPMERGSRLINRIEDFREALLAKAGMNDDLINLVYRVRWACNGVRTIGNARSHDSTPLSESESLELCSCLSGIGAAMPTLAMEFEVCRPSANQLIPSGLISDPSADLAKLLRQAASNGNQAAIDQSSLEALLKLVTTGGGGTSIAMGFQGTVLNQVSSPPQGRSNQWSPAHQASHLTPTLNGSIGQPASSPQLSTSSVGGAWGNPSPPSDTGSPQKTSISAPSSPPAAFVMYKKPSQDMLKLVSSFKFYHDRPADLPEENDIGRKIMFARMMNHINTLSKATLCQFQPGHDMSCQLSHSILEVMAYNPLYKRMICRQPDHYWSNQVQEDCGCACVHVDTGLEWKWMLEEKRSYCPQGARCINKKCIKSHSFEEMRWYNPWYKVNKCEKRVHEYIERARGVIPPPLDCIYYHIEDGSNADKREFTTEYDYVGKNVKMLFVERSHKPLADALEAVRYARANNL